MTHLKRLVASKTWPIRRKETAYTTRPSPGPHKASVSLPLNVVMRDLLKITASTKETKKVLNSGEILIDHKVRKDHHRVSNDKTVNIMVFKTPAGCRDNKSG